MEFVANYFDGKSTKTHIASVKTYSSFWQISYTDENNHYHQTKWKIDEIQKSEVYTKDLVAFKLGNKFPFERLESFDKRFIEYISKSEHNNINNKLDVWLHKSKLKSIILLLLTIIGIVLVGYFYAIPNMAVRFAENLPKSYVKQFGNSVFNILSKNLEIDEKQSQNLQNFVNNMKLDNDFHLKVYVAKEDTMNAFAISGGIFVIYTGLLEKLQNEHQLAALIGHEISHIQNRHMLKNVARNLSGALFISILVGDVGGATAVISESAHDYMQLSYSRELEKEADIKGLTVLKKNNLDQDGMHQLFEILNNETKIDIPEFLSSHPMLNDRIAYSKTIAKNQKDFTPNKALKQQWDLIKSNIKSDKIISND